VKLTLADDRPPIPPADLILRVALSFDPETIDANRREFDLHGLKHLGYFERALAGIGHEFTDFERLLDFGCGCGRFLRHMGAFAEQVELHGVDIDGEMIAWCERNIPFATFATGPHAPPLPYPDHHFDLVINHSVFSHLDEHLQHLWLLELQRITRPSAVLLLTVEGTSSWNRTVEASASDDIEKWREELETRGVLFISDDHFVGSTHPDFYHSSVNAPWYVLERWPEYFDIAAYLPDGSITQDLVVLRRRDDGAEPPRSIGRRAHPVIVEVPAPVAPAPPRPPDLIARALARLERLIRRALGRRPAPVEPPAPPPPAGPQALPRPRNTPAGDAEADPVERELKMMRVGLYEQANRISVIASELRREMDELKGDPPGGNDAPPS
jgi:SAM-dependent methyltransferase